MDVGLPITISLALEVEVEVGSSLSSSVDVFVRDVGVAVSSSLSERVEVGLLSSDVDVGLLSSEVGDVGFPMAMPESVSVVRMVLALSSEEVVFEVGLLSSEVDDVGFPMTMPESESVVRVVLESSAEEDPVFDVRVDVLVGVSPSSSLELEDGFPVGRPIEIPITVDVVS